RRRLRPPQIQREALKEPSWKSRSVLRWEELIFWPAVSRCRNSLLSPGFSDVPTLPTAPLVSDAGGRQGALGGTGDLPRSCRGRECPLYFVPNAAGLPEVPAQSLCRP